MINLNSTFDINERNDYSYIFDEDIGNGFYFGHLDGNGHGFSNRFGLSDGDGDSYSSKNLIRKYKTN